MRNLSIQQNDENTGYKFDARLRYVENLVSCHMIFFQADNDLRSKREIKPQEKQNWLKYLLDLYDLLHLHDEDLPEPDIKNITEEYVKKLKYHDMIKQVTENRTKKNDPNQAIRNKFKT